MKVAAFDPKDVIDARKRVAANIVRRRGQPVFRKALVIGAGVRVDGAIERNRWLVRAY